MFRKIPVNQQMVQRLQAQARVIASYRAAGRPAAPSQAGEGDAFRARARQVIELTRWAFGIDEAHGWVSPGKVRVPRMRSAGPAEFFTGNERQAAQDLMRAGYRPTAQRGHIERPTGAGAITNERVWGAMREALARH